MIIDVHAHYVKKDGYLDQMLEKSHMAGVKQIWLNGAGPQYGQHDNRQVLNACEKHTGRLVPIAFFLQGKNTASDVRSFARDGFRGLKIQFPLAPYDDHKYFRIYEEAESLGMPILFHTGASARFARNDRVWRTSSAFMRPVFLETIAIAFPDLNIIGAHLGWPWCWESSSIMLFNPNIYFDLSGIDRTGEFYPNLLNFKELLWAGERHWGKLVFGTEGNPNNYRLLAEEYRALFHRFKVDKTVQEKIMAGNASGMLVKGEKNDENNTGKKK
jgi:predicted TIM-barrel fold metal-dependent hydrolase